MCRCFSGQVIIFYLFIDSIACEGRDYSTYIPYKTKLKKW